MHAKTHSNQFLKIVIILPNIQFREYEDVREMSSFFLSKQYVLKTYCTGFLSSSKVVSDYINTMKTTFYFNFGLYQAVRLHGYMSK